MKKKLLALLLAVMMVVAMLPLSVFAEALQGAAGDAQNPSPEAQTYPTPAEDDYFQLVNAVGAHIGYYKTIDEVDADWDDNLTIRLLRDYELTQTWSIGATREKRFASDAAKDASDDPLNNAVFDGNGHKLYTTPGKSFAAVRPGPHSYWDCITFRNLTVVSGGIGIWAAPDASGQGGFIFENCQIWGGNAYYLVNPSFYASAPTPTGSAAVVVTGMSQRLSLTGAQTVVAAWSGAAVLAEGGHVELVDGLYYSHTGAATVYNKGNGTFLTNTSDHVKQSEMRCIYIHGGTYVNRTQAVVATRTGFAVNILGGTFLQTGENAAAGATLSAISVGLFDTSTVEHSMGVMRLAGGSFFVAAKEGCTSTPVLMDADLSYLQLLGNPAFYGPTEWALSGTAGTLVDGVRVGDFNVLNAIAPSTEAVTYDMPEGLADVSITAAFAQSVGLSDTTAADAVIYDKTGTAISALMLDGTGGSYALTRTSGQPYVQMTYTDTAAYQVEQVRTCFDYVPAFGKMVLQKNVLLNSVSETLRGAGGAAPITVDGQSKQFGFYRNYDMTTGEAAASPSSGYILLFNYGGNVTFRDLIIRNTHHGLNFGGNGMQLKITLDNVEMRVGANGQSSFCLNTGDTELNLVNGTQILSQGNCQVFQLRGYSRVNVRNSTIQNGGAGTTAMFHQTPDRRNMAATAGYFDWIDVSADVTLDGATLKTAGDLMRFFSASPATSQSGSDHAVSDADHVSTVITALNGAKLQFTANNTAQMGDVSELTLSTAVTVLDVAGNTVATAPSVETAAGYLREGYTVQMAKESIYFAGTGLGLPYSPYAWTLDGNGAVLIGGAGGNDIAAVIGALNSYKADTDVTVKNLTVASTSAGAVIGKNASTKASAMTLENVKIYAGGSYISSTAIGKGCAYVVKGSASYLRIAGEDTTAYAPKAGISLIRNQGQLGIYAGRFENGTQGNCAEFIITRSYSSSDNKSSVRYAPTTTIYGGTFVASTSTTTMIRSDYGGTNVILGGTFILQNTANTPILAGATSGYGYNYIFGGEFYSKSAGVIYAPVAADNTYTVFAGGAFYGQVAESNIRNVAQTTKFTAGYLELHYFGTRLDDYYKVTTQSNVTVDNTTVDFHLPDEANGTYATVTTVGYNAANATVAAKFAAVDGDLSRVAEVADFEVTDGYSLVSKFLFDFEADRAFSSMGDGGKLMLLHDVTVTRDHSISNFYTNQTYERGIQGQIYSPYFSYTVTSKGAARYTLTVKYAETITDSYFAFNLFGGDVTVENVTLDADEDTFRGLMEYSVGGNYTILTIRNAAIMSRKLSAIKSVSGGSGLIINVCEGGVITGNGNATAGSAIECSSANATVNVYEGAVIGAKSASATAAISSNCIQMAAVNGTVNVYGGFLIARGGQSAIVTQTGAGHVVNIYDGRILGGYGVNITHSSNVHIYGGSFQTNNSSVYVNSGTNASTVIIDGGTFECVSTSDAEAALRTHGSSSGSTVIVNGGTFVRSNTSGHVANLWGSNTLTFNGGTFLHNGSGTAKIDRRAIYVGGAKHVTINDGVVAKAGDPDDGVFVGTEYQQYEALGFENTTVDIYGGEFWAMETPRAVMDTNTGALVNVHGGTFHGNDRSVLYVSNDGVTNSESGTGTDNLKKAPTATLNVYGGTFILHDNGKADSGDHAVVRMGGTSETGIANIYGGLFVNDMNSSNQVLFKNNTGGSMYVKGGVLLASANQSHYFKTNGCIPATIDGYTPTDVVPNADANGNIPVDHSSLQVRYGDKQYYMLALGAATDETFTGMMKNGAQVRLAEDSNGLRFVSEFDADVRAELEARATANGTVSYGTLIVPLTYLIDTQGVFTHAALRAAGKNMADIVATQKGTSYASDGTMTIRAALVNIKTENYGQIYAAVSYAKVSVDGVDTYYYSAFNSTYHARSMKQTCTKALGSLQQSICVVNGVSYAYQSIVSGFTGYSRYNAAQQRALAKYAGYAVVG